MVHGFRMFEVATAVATQSHDGHHGLVVQGGAQFSRGYCGTKIQNLKGCVFLGILHTDHGVKPIINWLVVLTILRKILVHGKDYHIYYGK